jgi:RNA polymerase sigma-70 factor, ECF subfamily
VPIDVDTFQSCRPALLALAYRMLGDVGRAEDMVQEAWVHAQRGHETVEVPKAYLLTTLTRLCLDELGSARARREESRSDRLPEPVELDDGGLGRVETYDQISMAFLVLLQRLTPAERAVFLLHDVFDLEHAEIAARLGKTEAACRQMLGRARENLAVERRVLLTSREEHRRLLLAFVRAVNQGDREGLTQMLAEDAVFIADAGPNGSRYGRIRSVGRPVRGRKRIAALLSMLARQANAPSGQMQERMLNGQPSIVVFRDGHAVVAILVAVADGRIQHVFLQLDPDRLKHIHVGH